MQGGLETGVAMVGLQSGLMNILYTFVFMLLL
jgi:hypothetical protein